MEFIIDCSELAKLVEKTRDVVVVNAPSRIDYYGCPNCRSNCDTWCTALNANKLH